MDVEAKASDGMLLCRLKHDPEKWNPVFGQDHAQTAFAAVLAS
jgi:hypothetical protein